MTDAEIEALERAATREGVGAGPNTVAELCRALREARGKIVRVRAQLVPYGVPDHALLSVFARDIRALLSDK